MWLDLPHIINKDEIMVVTGLCSTGLVPTLKAVKNDVMMKLIKENFDKCTLMVNDIDELTLKYASMMVGYSIFYTNRENFVFTTAIHTAHKMVKEGLDINLCELLRLQLMKNL